MQTVRTEMERRTTSHVEFMWFDSFQIHFVFGIVQKLDSS